MKLKSKCYLFLFDTLYFRQQFSEWFNAEELVDNLKKFYPQPPSVPLNTKEIFDHLKILYDDDNYIEVIDIKNIRRRTRINYRDTIKGITKPSIKRLARRGGVKRISGLLYEDTRGLLKKFLEYVPRDTIIYMENGKRRTVTYMDVGDPSTAQPDSSNIVGSNVVISTLEESNNINNGYTSSSSSSTTLQQGKLHHLHLHSLLLMYGKSDKPNYFSQNSSPEDSRRYYKKDSRRSKPLSQPIPAPIIPPLEDQNSWPAPAEVLIKDKEKEVNSESSEKKQSLPNELGLKKEESPKKGKGKWIPYEELTITHNPPLPGHDRPKTRRRSEDHAGYRDRRSSEKTPSPEARYQSSSSSKRRASVPPPLRDNGRRYFNYNENNQNGNHISYNGSSSYRGSRRGGRGRSYNGQRGISRSASFSYTTPIYNHQNYGNFYGTKIGMDSEGYVDISLLAGFNRVKALTLEEEIIREALLNSHIVEVKGDKVRKRDEWGFWLLPKQVLSNNDPQNNINVIPYDNYSDLRGDNIALKNNVNGELINSTKINNENIEITT
nr:3493_t:CDS:10 [Entrophospora candida]